MVDRNRIGDELHTKIVSFDLHSHIIEAGLKMIAVFFFLLMLICVSVRHGAKMRI